MEQLSRIKTSVFLLTLIFLFVIEHLFPFYLNRKNGLFHDMRNIGMGLINVVALSPLFSMATLFVSQSAFSRKVGLLNRIDLPLSVEIPVLFLLFDLWMYAWHWMNHKIPFLWKFHLVHHSDTEVSASTALRFHIGEIFLSGIARLGIILLMGLQAWQIILYEIVLMPVILFHHSNINLIEKADKLIRILLVTPRLHRVHHSKVRDEMDTNYSSIFSFWDRIFGTIQLKQSIAEIEQGVDGIGEKDSTHFLGMLLLPFYKRGYY
jgi:sterol desaturase/sphingolipid hydroxylase (fatty acid hydroxylase superfamily)